MPPLASVPREASSLSPPRPSRPIVPKGGHSPSPFLAVSRLGSIGGSFSFRKGNPSLFDWEHDFGSPPNPPANRAVQTCTTMASALQDGNGGAGTSPRTYSRKEKSLGLLCENFMAVYGSGEQEEVSLDAAAAELGVERRRIYDIVNVLESVQVVVRKAKNRYQWNGMERLPTSLEELKHEPDEGTTANGPNGPQGASMTNSAKEKKREKSLNILTRKFVKVFLKSGKRTMSLEEAAASLAGEGAEPAQLKTKVRRLYDIANILCSLNLIEKTHVAESRKPAFRWMGVEEDPNFKVVTKQQRFGDQATGVGNDGQRENKDTGQHVPPKKRGVKRPAKITPLAEKNGQEFGGKAPKLNGHACPTPPTHMNGHGQHVVPMVYPFPPPGLIFPPMVPGQTTSKHLPEENPGAEENHSNMETMPILSLPPLPDVPAGSVNPRELLGYQNETINRMMSQYVDAWRNWYTTSAS